MRLHLVREQHDAGVAELFERKAVRYGMEHMYWRGWWPTGLHLFRNTAGTSSTRLRK